MLVKQKLKILDCRNYQKIEEQKFEKIFDDPTALSKENLTTLCKECLIKIESKDTRATMRAKIEEYSQSSSENEQKEIQRAQPYYSKQSILIWNQS